MNKLEQLHLQAIELEVYVDTKPYDVHFVADTDRAASKSAEITQQIAVEFAEWIAYTKKHGGVKPLQEALIQYRLKTTEELFQEFLKTKQ